MVVRNLADSLVQVRTRHGAKLLRFGVVSAFNVVFGQILLYTLQVSFGVSPVAANTISVCIGTVPAYVLSRYWVWQKTGKNHLMREVVPFWALVMAGFLLSTLAVWYVDDRFNATPILVNLASLSAYGVVWISKFFILERILFKTEAA